MTHAETGWLAVKQLPAEYTRRGYTHVGHFNMKIKLKERNEEDGEDEEPMLTE